MATSVPITGLPVLAPASVQGDDLLPIVDVHDLTDPTGTTKQVILSALWQSVNVHNGIFNVCDPKYGADPTGATDSTAAIQAAIVAAEASLASPNLVLPQSPIVYLPYGTYKITATLLITLPIELRGAGKQSSLIQLTTPNIPAITVSQVSVGNTYYAYYRLRHFAIQGLNTYQNFSVQDAQDGILVTSTTQDVPAWIESVRIAYMTGNGINLVQTGDSHRVMHCEVEYCCKSGLSIGGQFNTNFLVYDNIFQLNRKGISVVADAGHTLATGRIDSNLIQNNSAGIGGFQAGIGGAIGSTDRPSQGLYMSAANSIDVVSNYFENQANDLYLGTPVCTYNNFVRNRWEFANSYNLPHIYGGPPLVNLGIYLADGYENAFSLNISAERPNRAVTSCTTTEWGTGTFGDIYNHVTDASGADRYLDNIGLDSLGGTANGTLLVTNTTFSHVIRNQTGALAGGRHIRTFETFGESQRQTSGIREQWIGLTRTMVLGTTLTQFNDVFQFPTNSASERAFLNVQQGSAGTVVPWATFTPYGVLALGMTYGTTTVSVDYGSSTPGAGTYAVGSIRYNSAPTSGGFVGWVCITAGTPGTWKTFGVIS